MNYSRRSFMKYASLAASGNALGLNPFGSLSALAQSSGDYKALVCLFLYGGNDTNNVIIPGAQSADYANYAALRQGLALNQNQLLPLNGQSSLMLNAAMPNLQAMFNSGSAAMIANTGSLIQPLTRAQYLAGGAVTPLNLFSHEDQQNIWQTAIPNTTGTTGWAGRVADNLAPSLGTLKVPIAISVSGSPIYGTGVTTSCLAVNPLQAGSLACSEGTACSGRLAAAQQLLTLNSGVTLIQADDTMSSNAYNYSQVMSSVLASTPKVTTTLLTNNPLKPQIEQILQIISARASLGAQRQIFFASLGGFDTHGDQLDLQAGLLPQVDAALAALYNHTGEMGIANQVTSFTMSEFSRALEPNTAGGSDHAWGTHVMVVGGGVKGGNIYGTFPTLELGGPNDAGSNGRWIPTTSSSQFVATLASWFGVPASSLPTLLPYLSNFSSQNLGFV